MKISVKILSAALASFAGAGLLVVSPSVGQADTIYQLTVDNCTGGCNPNPPASMGTVTLHQVDGDTVNVTVALVDPLRFVNTGLQDTIDFNIAGSPDISATGFSSAGFSLTSASAGTRHFDGFGDFMYSIQLAGGQGAPGADVSPLSFDINCLAVGCSLTEASFIGNAKNAIFGVDVYNPVNGNTGPIGVPGPIVGAGLPGLIMACGGLLVLARRRRQNLA